MRTRVLIAFFGLVVSGFALAESPEFSAECVVLDNRARDIESRIMDYDVVAGQFGAAVWRAYFDDDDLVYLVEHQDIGELGDGDVWYWFADRMLFRYQERARRRTVEADQPAEFHDVQRTMWFKPGGTLIEAQQACDGVGVVSVKEEGDAAYQRAAGLQGQVMRAMAGQRAGERFFCEGDDPEWLAVLLGKRIHYQPAGQDVELFIGKGEYKDDDKSLFEWRSKAPGYGAGAKGWVRRDNCKTGDERVLPWRAAFDFPAEISIKGCCDVKPPASVLAVLNAPRQAGFRCDQGELEVWFLRGGEMAVVKLEDATYTLPRVATGSGERFSDTGITLTTDGEQASLTRGDQTVFSACKEGS